MTRGQKLNRREGILDVIFPFRGWTYRFFFQDVVEAGEDFRKKFNSIEAEVLSIRQMEIF